MSDISAIVSAQSSLPVAPISDLSAAPKNTSKVVAITADVKAIPAAQASHVIDVKAIPAQVHSEVKIVSVFTPVAISPNLNGALAVEMKAYAPMPVVVAPAPAPVAAPMVFNLSVAAPVCPLPPAPVVHVESPSLDIKPKVQVRGDCACVCPM